jgi:hypothetical protein
MLRSVVAWVNSKPLANKGKLTHFLVYVGIMAPPCFLQKSSWPVGAGLLVFAAIAVVLAGLCRLAKLSFYRIRGW